jgi:rare lipoprotein A
MRPGVAPPAAGRLQRALGGTSLALLLAACGSTPTAPAGVPPAPGARAPLPKPSAASPAAASTNGATRRGGGYYMDDGPGDAPAAAALAAVPDAEPRVELLHRFANNPYVVFGRTYVPQREVQAFRQRGHGSWYGRKFHGQPTATGEIYDMYAMTAAHPTLPLPSYVRVTNVANGRSVIVRVNDRGPFLNERVIDLSYTAAWKLGYVEQGFAQVEVETIVPGTMTARRPTLGEVSAAAAPPPRARMTLPPAQTDASAPTPATMIAASPVVHVAAVRADALPAVTGATAVSVPAPAAANANAMEATSAAAPVAPPVAVAAQREVPASVPLPPVAQEANGVFLQLGAFSGKENAEAFRIHVARMLPWISEPITLRPKQGLVRVQLGPYADGIEAMAAAQRIRDALDVRPVIAR